MTKYEQQLIRDLRRSQGKVIGRLEKRLDRQVNRATENYQRIASLVDRVHELEQLVAIYISGDLKDKQG